MRWVAVLLLIMAGPVFGQDPHAGAQRQLPFTLTWPDHFVQRPLVDGYQLVDGRMIRTPLTVIVTAGYHAPLSGGRWRKVDGFDTPFRYQINKEPGGSGGENFTLIAVGQDNEGVRLRLMAIQQSEMWAPSFETAWQILSTYRKH